MRVTVLIAELQKLSAQGKGDYEVKIEDECGYHAPRLVVEDDNDTVIVTTNY